MTHTPYVKTSNSLTVLSSATAMALECWEKSLAPHQALSQAAVVMVVMAEKAVQRREDLFVFSQRRLVVETGLEDWWLWW